MSIDTSDERPGRKRERPFLPAGQGWRTIIWTFSVVGAGILALFGVSGHRDADVLFVLVKLAGITVASLFFMMFSILMGRRRRHFGQSLLALIFSFNLLIFGYAAVYWSIGDSSNFDGGDLTPLDAFYFTVGTLTTAGTGKIAAISQLSRLIVAVQMLLDLFLIAVVVAVLMPRLIEQLRRSRPRDSPGDAGGAPKA